MKANLLQFLKTLALDGALSGSIPVRSADLEQQMGLSQQSISNYLNALEADGMLERRLGTRLHHVTITERGRTALKVEHDQYLSLFSSTDYLRIHGEVITGIGDGAYYMAMTEYIEQFQRHLGFAPFPGTLNIRPDRAARELAESLRQREGIIIDGFHRDGRSFGAVACFPASCFGTEAAVIYPHRSPYRDVVEIISPHNLRESHDLVDGSAFEVLVRPY